MNSALFWGNLDSVPGNMVAARFIPCFAAGTPVPTPDGEKPIEQLRPGDLVLSRDASDVTSPVEAKRVEECFVREGLILELQANGQVIRTTPEHPFHAKDRGWTPAGELNPGDQLATHDGRWIPVAALEATGQAATVYNLRITDYHTYFVGSRHLRDWSH